jgi:hypothetical protein
MEADYGRGVGSLGGNSFDSTVYLGKNFPMANLSFSAADQRNFFQSQDSFYQSSFPDSLRKQTLPEVQSRLYPIEIGQFYLDAGVRASRLAYRLEDADSSPTAIYDWNREDAFAHLQGRLGQWGPFRADLQTLARFTDYSASLSNPLYSPDAIINGTALNPAFNPYVVDGGPLQRTLGSARLQLSGPQLGRTFENFSLFGYHGELKHLVEPFVGLTETSRSHVEAYIPRFDDVDSRPGVNGSAMGEESVEMGLMNHFMGRPGQGDTYADLVRWKLSSKYYFRPILVSDGTFKQGWASIDSDLDAEPAKGIRINFRSSADIQQGGTDNSLSVNLAREDGSQLNLGIFSAAIDRFLVRQRGIQLGGLKRFMDDRFRLEFQVNYNYQEIVSSQIALAYMTPCVAASIRYTHLALDLTGSLSNEDRLDLVLSLRTLGDFPLFSHY